MIEPRQTDLLLPQIERVVDAFKLTAGIFSKKGIIPVGNGYNGTNTTPGVVAGYDNFDDPFYALMNLTVSETAEPLIDADGNPLFGILDPNIKDLIICRISPNGTKEVFDVPTNHPSIGKDITVTYLRIVEADEFKPEEGWLSLSPRQGQVEGKEINQHLKIKSVSFNVDSSVAEWSLQNEILPEHLISFKVNGVGYNERVTVSGRRLVFDETKTPLKIGDEIRITYAYHLK